MFESGKVYIVDYAGNVSKPYISMKEALKDTVNSDTVLIALSAKDCKDKKKEENKPIITSLVINFKDNVVFVEGGVVKLGGYPFLEGANTLTDFALKAWENIVKDAYNVCKNTIIKGQPPVKGENLNALLHL